MSERDVRAPELTPPGPRRRDAEPERVLEVAIDRSSSLSPSLLLSVDCIVQPQRSAGPDQRQRGRGPAAAGLWMQSTADMLEHTS